MASRTVPSSTSSQPYPRKRPATSGGRSAGISSNHASSTASTSLSASTGPSKERQRYQVTANQQKPTDSDGNISVYVRCRGRLASELEHDVPCVAETSATRGTSVILRNISAASVPSSSLAAASALPTRTFDFGDRKVPGKTPQGNVFGDEADQGMIYQDVVKPVLEQVLQGYNCTIFAYGQTGTGKTFTMEGDLSPFHGTFSPSAGIIPRTMFSLFDKLADADFSVRCSFIELYNEEIRDLNGTEYVEPSGTNQPMDQRTQGVNAPPTGGLKIYDDKNSGTGVTIQGLEETLISCVEDGLKILKRGSERRQMAATNCNEHSSRSHSIFTITVHINETSKSGGEDVLKIGKLNLVDLAGSENVGRSGAENGRAREAGMINSSLLALGRVINKLSEKQSHIPYRESKLTRLLQDSLGGRTKTTIIATISPTNFEETSSTLDYALRATAIQNRPEINQKITKSLLLGQYASEIEHLKADLLATRKKNGIFFSEDSWASISSEHEAERSQLQKARVQVEVYESQLQTSRDQFEQNLRLLGVREEELRVVRIDAKAVSDELQAMILRLKSTEADLKEQTRLREVSEMSKTYWEKAAQTAILDVSGLRDKIDRKVTLESSNLAAIENAKALLRSNCSDLATHLSTFHDKQSTFAENLKTSLANLADRHTQALQENAALVEGSMMTLEGNIENVMQNANHLQECGESIRKVVSEVRDELVFSVELQIGKAKEAQEQQASSFLSNLAIHEAQATKHIEGLLGPLKLLQRQLAAGLANNLKEIQQLQHSNQELLAAENKRLKEAVTRLQNTLEEDRAVAARENENTVALLKADLNSRANRRNKTLALAYESVEADVETTIVEMTGFSRTNGIALRSLEEGVHTTELLIGCQVEAAEALASEGLKDLSSTNAAIRADLSSHTVFMSQASTSQTEAIRIAGKQLTTCETEFRVKSTASNALLKNTLERLQERARSSRDSSAAATQQAGFESEEMLTDLADTTQSSLKEVAEFHEASSSIIGSMKADVTEHLENRIQIDTSTGSTPQKRKAPLDGFMPVVSLNEADKANPKRQQLSSSSSSDAIAGKRENNSLHSDVAPLLTYVDDPLCKGTLPLVRQHTAVLTEQDKNRKPMRKTAGRREAKDV